MSKKFAILLIMRFGGVAKVYHWRLFSYIFHSVFCNDPNSLDKILKMVLYSKLP